MDTQNDGQAAPSYYVLYDLCANNAHKVINGDKYVICPY
jgi:hypothetical protein